MSPQKVRVHDGWTCRAGLAQLRGGYHSSEEDPELSQLSEYLGLSHHLGHPSSDMSGTNESQTWWPSPCWPVVWEGLAELRAPSRVAQNRDYDSLHTPILSPALENMHLTMLSQSAGMGKRVILPLLLFLKSSDKSSDIFISDTDWVSWAKVWALLYTQG